MATTIRQIFISISVKINNFIQCMNKLSTFFCFVYIHRMCGEVPSFQKVFCFQVQRKYLELYYVVHKTSVLRCHTAKHLQNWKIQLHSYKVYQKNYLCIVTIIFVQKLHQFLQFFWTCILRSHPKNYS